MMIKDIAAGVEGSKGEITISRAVASEVEKSGIKMKMVPTSSSKTLFKVSCEELCKCAKMLDEETEVEETEETTKKTTKKKGDK